MPAHMQFSFVNASADASAIEDGDSHSYLSISLC
jgi:hypothetical protein